MGSRPFEVGIKKTNPSVHHVTSWVGQYKFAQKSVQKLGKSDSLPYKAEQVQVYMIISLNRAKKPVRSV